MAELPSFQTIQDAFACRDQEVAARTYSLQNTYNLPHQARAMAAQAISAVYLSYGGYNEPPILDQFSHLPYHNGSRSMAVLETALFLGQDNKDRREPSNGAIVIAAVYEGWYQDVPSAGENKKLNAQIAQQTFTSLGVRNGSGLEEVIAEAIIGSTIIVHDGVIQQKAGDSSSNFVRCVADASLAPMIAPNAIGWALRLLQEQTGADSLRALDPEITRSFLMDFVKLQRGHQFLSKLGQGVLQPLLKIRAHHIEKVLDTTDPSDLYKYE